MDPGSRSGSLSSGRPEAGPVGSLVRDDPWKCGAQKTGLASGTAVTKPVCALEKPKAFTICGNQNYMP